MTLGEGYKISSKESMEKNLNKSKTQQHLLDNAYAEWALNANKGFRNQPSYNEYFTLESSPENVKKAIDDLDLSNTCSH